MNSQIDALVAEAEAGELLGISAAYESARFDADGARAVAERVRAHPDASSLHLLLALRREAPAVYGELPPELRAAVLTDALRTVPFLNDFSALTPDGPGHDRTAAQALLELGDAARAPLSRCLTTAGSEAATISALRGYRRSDFAYRYLAKLLGRDAGFAAEPAECDPAIRALRDELA